MSGPEVAACRRCGTAIYLVSRSAEPQVGDTGRYLEGRWVSEHWRHVEDDDRYCPRGNGAVAEPYDGSGPIAEKLRRWTEPVTG